MVQIIEDRRNSEIQLKLRGNLPLKKKRVFMNEAISRTKFGLFNYVLIFLCGLILDAAFLDTSSMALVIPVSQCDLNLTAGERGILTSVSYFGIICSGHSMGYLADTKGRRKIILPTLFIAFFMSIASSFVENLYLFATLRFLNGFFISAASSTIYAYLAEFHDNLHSSTAIMWSSVIYAIGCGLLPTIAWLVINQDWQFDIPFIGITYKPWRLFLIVCSIPGFLSGLILLFLPESPKFVLGQGDSIGTWKILQKMDRWNNGKTSQFEMFEIYEEEDSIENRRQILAAKKSRFTFLNSIWNQTAQLFKPPHLFSTLLICTIQFGICLTSLGFYMFFPDIANKMAKNLDNFTDQRIAMCDVINMKSVNLSTTENSEVCITKIELETIGIELTLEFVFVVGFGVIGLIIHKVGKFPILFTVLMGCGSCAIISILTDIPMVQIYSLVVLLCVNWGTIVVNSATVEIYPTTLRASAIGISLMFGRLGGVVGANTVALLIDNHCEIVFYSSGLIVIVAGLLTYFIPHIHDKHEGPITPNEPRLSVASLRH